LKQIEMCADIIALE